MARPQTNYICREYPAEKTGRNNSLSFFNIQYWDKPIESKGHLQPAWPWSKKPSKKRMGSASEESESGTQPKHLKPTWEPLSDDFAKEPR